MAALAAQNAADAAPAPFEHKLVKFDLVGDFHYTFTVGLELDLSDPQLCNKSKLQGNSILLQLHTLSASSSLPAMSTCSTLLSRSSPYLKTLFQPAFAENKTFARGVQPLHRGSKRSDASTEVDAQDFADSDNETDELSFNRHPLPPPRFKESSPTSELVLSPSHRFRQQSSYDSSEDAPIRKSRIDAAVAVDPSLSYPVSPKSVFRLARLLELDNLQEPCLANLSKQLTFDCAPYELFSDTSVCYDDWRKIMLEFVADNCDAGTAANAWAELAGRVKRDEIRGAAPVMLDSFKRKVPKTGAC
ncbi:proteophosphoglycan ppg4 [Rhodotorula toruloides]|uniref:Proteophosphoglycan ppg4 n=1 Tax=Rhodotorula toruloides TaxID=5286 RepID=A0A511KCA0_RHOTO|nr:proteophosphoglycan ppg4 [Rhodotorula toruloides]